jgi:hypothetical protein
VQRRFLVAAPWPGVGFYWHGTLNVQYNSITWKGLFVFTLWTSSSSILSSQDLPRPRPFQKGIIHLGPQASPSVPKTFISTHGSEYCKPQHQGSPHTKSIGKALLSVMPMTQTLFSNCLDPRICSTLKTWNPLTFVKKKPLHIKAQVRMRERANCIACCLCTNCEGWKKWGPTFVPSIGAWNNLGWKITR